MSEDTPPVVTGHLTIDGPIKFVADDGSIPLEITADGGIVVYGSPLWWYVLKTIAVPIAVATALVLS